MWGLRVKPRAASIARCVCVCVQAPGHGAADSPLFGYVKQGAAVIWNPDADFTYPEGFFKSRDRFLVAKSVFESWALRLVTMSKQES